MIQQRCHMGEICWTALATRDITLFDPLDNFCRHIMKPFRFLTQSIPIRKIFLHPISLMIRNIPLNSILDVFIPNKYSSTNFLSFTFFCVYPKDALTGSNCITSAFILASYRSWCLKAPAGNCTCQCPDHYIGTSFPVPI